MVIRIPFPPSTLSARLPLVRLASLTLLVAFEFECDSETGGFPWAPVPLCICNTWLLIGLKNAPLATFPTCVRPPVIELAGLLPLPSVPTLSPEVADVLRPGGPSLCPVNGLVGRLFTQLGLLALPLAPVLPVAGRLVAAEFIDTRFPIPRFVTEASLY